MNRSLRVLARRAPPLVFIRRRPLAVLCKHVHVYTSRGEQTARAISPKTDALWQSARSRSPHPRAARSRHRDFGSSLQCWDPPPRSFAMPASHSDSAPICDSRQLRDDVGTNPSIAAQLGKRLGSERLRQDLTAIGQGQAFAQEDRLQHEIPPAVEEQVVPACDPDEGFDQFESDLRCQIGMEQRELDDAAAYLVLCQSACNLGLRQHSGKKSNSRSGGVGDQLLHHIVCGLVHAARGNLRPVRSLHPRAEQVVPVGHKSIATCRGTHHVPLACSVRSATIFVSDNGRICCKAFSSSQTSGSELLGIFGRRSCNPTCTAASPLHFPSVGTSSEVQAVVTADKEGPGFSPQSTKCNLGSK